MATYGAFDSFPHIIMHLVQIDHQGVKLRDLDVRGDSTATLLSKSQMHPVSSHQPPRGGESIHRLIYVCMYMTTGGGAHS